MVTLEELKSAARRLRGVVTRTPLLPYLGHDADRTLHFKPESLQHTGSFKLRGAYNKIASLSKEEVSRGVIAYSSGNHAQGVAYAARQFGARAVIVVPENISRMKLDATRTLGAEVVYAGNDSQERKAKAEKLSSEHGYTLVAPYNDESLIAGQGTIGLEILEALPAVETVLVPVSGGGLISGIAAALKLIRSEVNVIGVEPELAGDAQASLRSGELIGYTAEETKRTVADGLRSQQLGDITFAHIKRFVDDIVTVSEDEIIEATRRLMLEAKLVAEPSGAVTFAAYLYRKGELPSTTANVAVISGGNVQPELLADILMGFARTSAHNT